MGSQVWSLLSLGVGLNLVLGTLVAALKLPIYLDSLGTVLVAALAGPWAASLTAGCGAALLGFTNPTALAFLPVGMAVGILAGVSARLGIFRRGWSAGLFGAIVGCAGAALSAPIATYMFGGVTGGGTDLMVAVFRAAGLSTQQATLAQGLLVDPLDKLVTFLLVYAMLRALPRRATAAFPLAEGLPGLLTHDAGENDFRPQRLLAAGTVRREEVTSTPGQQVREKALPEAPTGLKLVALLSVLLAAGLSSRPEPLCLGLLTLTLTYFLAAPRLTWQVLRNVLLLLLPLAFSLLLIHGFIARDSGPRVVALGLSWSLPGLLAAWHFLSRIAVMLLALSMFLASTSLHRLAEFLLRCRVPYPLVFLLLTGVNLGARLRARWHAVEEAQESRGLQLRPPGLWARARVLVGLLTPTVGAVFNELPTRAANLESRGFLEARPKSPIPLEWTVEGPPSTAGFALHGGIVAASAVYIVWLFS